MKRREFLSSAAAGAAALATSQQTLAIDDTGSEKVKAEAALKMLLDGNQRFVDGKTKHPRTTGNWLDGLQEGQHPFATILACSDSRVPLALLFDQGFGDIFSIRVAGNVVTRYGIGSIEYAQHHLRTPLFMVLGHEGCGAVGAAMLPKKKRDQEPKGVRELLDLVHLGKLDASASKKAQAMAAVEANARHSANQLRDLDPDEEGFQLQPGEMLVSAVFDLTSGRVRILEKH